MFCPKCGSEYRPGFQECTDCGVRLVEHLPAPPKRRHPDIHLVKVYESGDPALIALARSLLESAGIPFLTQGEGIQDFFGWGRAPANFNIVTGPVQFQVDEKDAGEAHTLLADLHETSDDSIEIDSQREDDR
jgi:putative signal transducing protein